MQHATRPPGSYAATTRLEYRHYTLPFSHILRWDDGDEQELCEHECWKTEEDYQKYPGDTLPSPRYAGMVNTKAKARIERSVDHHQIGTIGAPQKGQSTRY